MVLNNINNLYIHDCSDSIQKIIKHYREHLKLSKISLINTIRICETNKIIKRKHFLC